MRCSKALNENHVPATFGVDAGATVAAAASSESDNISPLKRGPIKRRLVEDSASTSAARSAKRSKHDHDVIANLNVPSLSNAEPAVREKAAGAYAVHFVLFSSTCKIDFSGCGLCLFG